MSYLQCFSVTSVDLTDVLGNYHGIPYDSRYLLLLPCLGTYFWVENSFIECKSTSTSISFRLYPTPPPSTGETVVGIFIQYRPVTREAWISERFYFARWQSERQLVGLESGTNYEIRAVLYLNPPGRPMPSLNLPAYTLAEGKFGEVGLFLHV